MGGLGRKVRVWPSVSGRCDSGRGMMYAYSEPEEHDS